ncbi:lipid II:glycine glycyltransferase FemX [Lysinibacter cavernae]|uniref:Lipid II:glycine glycyltransferase (Peptidoglycan interpeptide bridge formation enzyme) n=1 Tax=Lysinibacter cavernae TaxID=1640652 RepID=A0A7X5R1M5_9MICO|nr:peptidoglycan bridge formation glycyltransferase FemA/FemB family protein [Lysinibacter cavernae]NIH53862.1 lipid II:glycine glycyltransferase (peptidoglycan interpeptide bridge formation enzyme) [Lysinibacter cavernae]
MTLRVDQCTDRVLWDEAVNLHDGNPLQLWGWGQTKAEHNWTVERLLVHDGDELIGSAQVLFRSLPWPLRSLAYIARGPQTIPGRSSDVLAQVESFVRSRGAVVLSIEPDWDADSEPATRLVADGWRFTDNTILIPRTLILDLNKSEDELQAAMSKKTRQYIRKSAKEALEFRRVTRDELGKCLAVYRQTAERAHFGIHVDEYYFDVFDNLGDASPVFAAFQGESVVAFLWLAASDSTAFELYGGMNDDGQRLKANYNLKWTAITAMKQQGITRYDFNGLLNDGVSQFKFGFADHENMLAGTWDKPLNGWYGFYSKALPFARRTLSKLRGLLKGK